MMQTVNLAIGKGMRIASFKRIISPEIGTDIAGYGRGDHTVAKLDDLYMSGL